MPGGSGSPVCWTLASRGTPNTRRPLNSTTLGFLGSLGTALWTQAKDFRNKAPKGSRQNRRLISSFLFGTPSSAAATEGQMREAACASPPGKQLKIWIGFI